MLRTFGVQTATGSAQPLFSDVTTAAIAIPSDGYPIRVPVGNTAIYQVGDRIILGVGQTQNNILLVEGLSVPTGAGFLLCKSEGDAPVKPYPTAIPIALSIAAMEVIVQADTANAGIMYVGADNTVTSAGVGSVVYELSQSLEPFRMTNSGSHNVVRTTDAWIAGAAGLKWVATAVVL